MEWVLNQKEQECPFKIYFCLRKNKSGAYFGEVLQVDWASFVMKPNLLQQVSRPCGPKIWNVAKLSNFIEKAVSAKAEEDLNREADCEYQTKQALPMTVMQEQRHAKKLLNDGKQINVGKASSRKALISENSSRCNSSNS